MAYPNWLKAPLWAVYLTFDPVDNWMWREYHPTFAKGTIPKGEFEFLICRHRLAFPYIEKRPALRDLLNKTFKETRKQQMEKTKKEWQFKNFVNWETYTNKIIDPNDIEQSVQKQLVSFKIEIKQMYNETLPALDLPKVIAQPPKIRQAKFPRERTYAEIAREERRKQKQAEAILRAEAERIENENFKRLHGLK